MDRLEEIRESLKTAQSHTTSLYWGPGAKRYPEDVSYLLERIEHLQRENERLKAEVEHVKESASMGLSKWREMVAVVPGWFESAAQGFDDSNQSDTLT